MILAFDVYYYENKAKSVAIQFEKWTDAVENAVFIEYIEPIADYEPGAFYKRELPCLMKILEKIDLASIEVLVVDGYVLLDDAGKWGLGAYLYEAIGKKIPVIGVAKTNFANNVLNVKKVFRGESNNPLYVSAIAIELEVAADYIKNMFGEFRIPKLLKDLDKITKEIVDDYGKK